MNYIYNEETRNILRNANSIQVTYYNGRTAFKDGQNSIKHLHEYNCSDIIKSFVVVK